MIVTGVYGFTYTAEKPQFVGGCHCCACCCGMLNAPLLNPNIKDTAQRSNYRVVKDYEKCASCGECVRRCQVFAHTFDGAKDEKPVYHPEKCVGCGSCGLGCPSGVLHLEPVSEEEWYHVPSNFQGMGRKAPEVSGITELARGGREPNTKRRTQIRDAST